MGDPINNKFVHFNTKADFDSRKGDCRNDAIVFCKEAGIIRTHEKDYQCDNIYVIDAGTLTSSSPNPSSEQINTALGGWKNFINALQNKKLIVGYTSDGLLINFINTSDGTDNTTIILSFISTLIISGLIQIKNTGDLENPNLTVERMTDYLLTINNNAGTELPLAPEDIAKVGESAKYAREDHVHPKQTDVEHATNADNATTAESANKVANALTIKVNGETKGTFDGSAATEVNIESSSSLEDAPSDGSIYGRMNANWTKTAGMITADYGEIFNDYVNNKAKSGAHAEGNQTTADGQFSHTEGMYTITQNTGEHAEGLYNVSNTGSTNNLKTRHSIGIGTPDARENAFEVMANGDIYMKGVGSYDGTNPTASQTVQEVLNSQSSSTEVYTEYYRLETTLPLDLMSLGDGRPIALFHCDSEFNQDSNYQAPSEDIITKIKNGSLEYNISLLVRREMTEGVYADFIYHLKPKVIDQSNSVFIDNIYLYGNNPYMVSLKCQGTLGGNYGCSVDFKGVLDGTVFPNNAIYGRKGDAWARTAGMITTEGGEIFNDYTNNKATAEAAHAEGKSTIAEGIGSHAQGDGTDGTIKASADGSFAGGKPSPGSIIANGWGSIAYGGTYSGTISTEGTGSIAIGSSDNGGELKSIGNGTITYGSLNSGIIAANKDGSFAGGYSESGDIQASEIGAFAQGYAETGYIEALGIGSFAQGRASSSTRISAKGEGSFAQGYSSLYNLTASGDGAHAEGYAGDGNITASGYGSHAEGAPYQGDTIASGTGSHAEGCITNAMGDYSHAEGYGGQSIPSSITSSSSYNDIVEQFNSYGNGDGFSLSFGKGSHTEGNNCLAYGDSSHAEGYRSKAKGIASHAEGGSAANADYSHAGGLASEANDDYAFAHGEEAMANFTGSVAMGGSCTANGVYSQAFGNYTRTESNYGMVIGHYNEFSNGGLTYSDSLFMIGRGSSSSRSNCLRVTPSKNYTASAWQTGGADYAEMFEWSDSNLDSEDRVGYFVELNGTKINKANSSSKNIIGIVSATPTTIGNSPDEWHRKYLTDEWGRFIQEEVEVELKNGTKVIEKQFKLNPDYNPEQTYINRDDRKEWAAIGLMGQLLVRQDGSLQVGDYCTSNDEGIATKSESGYYVMEIISDKIVKVLFK